ncbi:MAG: PilZ domain-containing protein [Magnetococcales bacterium]|nr:PilZ domain-containing protein [Magnetococcales bacterium]
MLSLLDVSGAVQEPEAIQRFIHTALLDHEAVEVTLDDHPESFHCFFMDFHPEVEGEATPYRTGSYLEDQEFLLTTPMEPAKGNAMIRRVQTVKIRFNEGQMGLRGEVRFLEVVAVAGARALKLSFPDKLVKFQERKSSRAKVTDGLVLKAHVQRTGIDPFEADVADISMYGLSFLYPDETTEIADGKRVQMEIRSADLGTLTLFGAVRNQVKSRDVTDIYAARRKCGVQFEETFAATLQKKLEALVKMVEQRHQQAMQRSKMRFMTRGG